MYEHITHVKTLNWNKDSTIENETINFPRQSLKAVVMLFRNKTVTDSEEFVFPNIETVKVTIEGTPNQIYGQGIPKSMFYDEAKRLFGNGAENPLITLKRTSNGQVTVICDGPSVESPDVSLCTLGLRDEGVHQLEGLHCHLRADPDGIAWISLRHTFSLSWLTGLR